MILHGKFHIENMPRTVKEVQVFELQKKQTKIMNRYEKQIPVGCDNTVIEGK